MPDAGETLRETFPNDPDSTDTLRTEDWVRRRVPIDAREGRVGPYRVLETIGEGGFGTVYLAEQVEPIRRRVALKIIKAGMDTKQVIARFEAERQALAMMNHPNVAKVFDAGATERGRPYFVMEHVPGVRITEHCDRHRLDVKERLDLFLQVCEAVQHAHQKGIIHRDIKPSNILVSVKEGKSLPKVIDFGVAKATAGRLTDKTVHTEQGQFIGTPAYMSPEQAEMTAQDIDTRSDIYSLGVLLYELLTGTLPFDQQTLGRAGHAEVQRILREVEPPKPSTRVGSASRTATSPGLGDGGDKEGPHSGPYTGSSIDEIARERRTDPPALRKQLRGDLDWITMKAMEKDRTRRYASASDFAADIVRHLRDEPVLAGPPSAAYRMKKFIRRNRLAVIAATAVFTALLLGIVATGIALTREARQRRLVEEQRNRAIEAEKVAATEAETAKQVSEFLVGIFKVSDPSESRGNTITAREILDLGAEKITHELSDQPAVRATLLDTIGLVYCSLGLFASAQPLLESALTIRRQELGNEHRDVAVSLDHLANSLEQDGKSAEAESAIREALAIYRKLLGAEHATVALSLAHLGGLLAHEGRLAEAEPLLREGLAINRKLQDEERPNNLVFSLYAMCGLLTAQGRLAEAEPLLREALAINRKRFGDKHLAVAGSLHELGCLLQGQGNLPEAEAMLRESLDIKSAALGNENWHCGNTRSRLGYGLTKMGRFADAERELLEAHRVLTASLGPQHGRTVGAVQRLVALYEAWDTAEPGKGYAEEAAEWGAKLDETSKSQNAETPK